MNIISLDFNRQSDIFMAVEQFILQFIFDFYKENEEKT
jgi:hypothetical protein